MRGHKWAIITWLLCHHLLRVRPDLWPLPNTFLIEICGGKRMVGFTAVNMVLYISTSLFPLHFSPYISISTSLLFYSSFYCELMLIEKLLNEEAAGHKEEREWMIAVKWAVASVPSVSITPANLFLMLYSKCSHTHTYTHLSPSLPYRWPPVSRHRWRVSSWSPQSCSQARPCAGPARCAGASSSARRPATPRPRAAGYSPSPESHPDPCEPSPPPQSSSALHTGNTNKEMRINIRVHRYV